LIRAHADNNDTLDDTLSAALCYDTQL
jgi:hypothetical protein